MCVQNTIFTVRLRVQNTDNSHRHVVCEEHRQFSPACCVWRTQTILTGMLCVKNTDNSHRHVVCEEHRQFSPVCCVWRTQTILTGMLCVKITDNSHRHVLCLEFRQTEHRQFSPSRTVCRIQRNRTQTILNVILCVQNTKRTQTILTVMLCVQNTNRTQTILTVILCVQNTVGRWRGHVHQRCRRLRVVTVAPAQSAVPAESVTLLPVGQSVLTHHVFSGTRMDRRWHSEGQHTTRQQQTEVSVQSFYCLHRLWAVLSILPSFFLSSLFPLSFLLLGSVCLLTLSFFSVLPSSFLLSFPFRRVLNSRERSWLARCSRHSKETTANKQSYNF